MKIKQLHLKNFRCFEDFDIDFITGDDNHGGMTVLVAKNGEGKTAILEAINIAWGPFIGKMPSSTGAVFDPNDATTHNRQATGAPHLYAQFENTEVGQMDFLSSAPHFDIHRELTQSKKRAWFNFIV